MNTLLEVLFHHTFQQCSTVYAYLRCLEVWIALLESTQSQYATVALTLAERVLQKISFKIEARTLKYLDTENLDENVRMIFLINVLLLYNFCIKFLTVSFILLGGD